jgi:sulfhydrogenase subunit gamma (sulfur reductase)
MQPTPFMPSRAVLREVIEMTDDNHLFKFTIDPAQLGKREPGQFVQVWVPGVGECPISLCSERNDEVLELCIRRAGRVTDALFKLKAGDWIGIRGPYGHGFPLDEFRGRDVCLIAGGLGIAPIRSLFQYVLTKRYQFGRVTVVYGMRHSIDLLFRHEFKALLTRDDIDIFIGAEEMMDGPELPPIPAQLGRVTDMIRLASLDSNFEVAVCGPPVMYPYVIKELKGKGIDEHNIWLSLERHMKCGIGKCGHCFIGGEFACQSGPVFQLSKLRFLAESTECEGVPR